MKQVRSKTFGVQKKTTSLARSRAQTVKAEMDELGLRNWKGSELEFATRTTQVRRELDTAVNALLQAEKLLSMLEKAAAGRGK